jgi:phage-related protein
MYNSPKGNVKRLAWIGSSREDLRELPESVRREAGYALYAAQQGETDPAAKALKGFAGASVMEIVLRHDKRAYRVVYTTRFKDIVFVLHVFQKKSRKGIATPTTDVELVKTRLAHAQRLFNESQN